MKSIFQVFLVFSQLYYRKYFLCFTKSHIFSIPGTRSQSTLIMDSLAFLPLRCPSNSLIMASFYILVLIYASCGTLWICWLSLVPSRPLVWTCCKSFTFYTPLYSPQLGKMFCEVAFSSFIYFDLQVLLKNRSQGLSWEFETTGANHQ